MYVGQPYKAFKVSPGSFDSHQNVTNCSSLTLKTALISNPAEAEKQVAPILWLIRISILLLKQGKGHPDFSP